MILTSFHSTVCLLERKNQEILTKNANFGQVLSLLIKMKPKKTILATAFILLILPLCIFNASSLLLKSCLLSVKCKGFKAQNSLSMEIENSSIFPKVAFLELRSPAALDYLLDEWKTKTKTSKFIAQDFSHWVGSPLKKDDFKFLIPVLLGPKTSLELALSFNQVIRNRLDLPLFRLTGFSSSLPWRYSITFDSAYQNIHSVHNPKIPKVQSAGNELDLSLEAGSVLAPRFEWSYQQILPMRASMG